MPEWASAAPLHTQRNVAIVALPLMFTITITTYVMNVEMAWVTMVLLVVALGRLLFILRRPSRRL